MQVKKIFIICSLCCSLFINKLLAQNIDISNVKKFGVSGGLSVNSLYNSNSPIGTDPFSYFVAGNVNVSVLGTTVPVNLSYSSRKFTYSQPFSFNQIALHPTYKWATAHVGVVSMTFSPYTLNGHQFNGVGVDLAPGNWRVSAMYGRLIRAQAGTETTPASFRRMGMGVKTQWQNDRFRVGLTTFNASDDTLSINPASPYTTVSPQKNLVMAVTAGASLFRIVQVDIEYSNSILEKNRLLTESDTIRSNVGFINRSNASAESYHALKGTLNALLPKTNTTVGLGFERVDPNYQTLGGYFFTNDFSNVTINASQSLWDGKLTGSGNLGIQRDDLKNEKSSSQKRMVAGVHVMAIPSPKLNLSVNYSNFKAYTFIRSALQDISRLSPLEQIDTLNFTQITRNFNANAVYQLQSSEVSTQSVMVTYMVMNAANKQGDLIRTGQTTQVYNSNINYNWTLPKHGFSLAAGLSYNQNSVVSQSFSAYGPTGTLSKTFFKNKLSNSLSTSYLITRIGELNTSVTNLRYNAGFALGEKQSFQLMVGGVFRGGKVASGSIRNYVNATFGYSLRL